MIRKFLVSAPVLAAAVVVFAASASAGPPKTASGTDSYALSPPSARIAGPNAFVDFSGTTAVLTGTFAGTVVFLPGSTYTFHADQSFQFSARAEWTGTVAGCGTGTIVFQVEANVVVVDGIATWSPHSHWTTLYGQGTLPVHATFDTSGDSDPGGQTGTIAYAGQYSC
jgi:hypothetical protein